YARSIKVSGGDRHESSRLMSGILATFEEQHIAVENNRGFFTYVLTSLADDALALGDPGTALHRARQAVELVPADGLAAAVLAAAAATRPPERCERVLLALASRDPTGEFFPAVVGKLAPANTARFCLAYCTEGGTHPEAVRVGLMAALLSGQPGVFRDLVRYAGRLDGEILQRIAERAR